MVRGYLKTVVLPQIIVFWILFISCQSLDTAEHKSQDGNEKKLPKNPPIPHTDVSSFTYLTHLARIEVDIYNEIMEYAQAVKERLSLMHA